MSDALTDDAVVLGTLSRACRQAGQAGFGLAVGVDRGGAAGALAANGAEFVVSDLGELC